MKTFVQYGAGNIGRGFIGALFSRAGYAVRFIDVDKQIISELNRRKSYEVEVVSSRGNSVVRVENVAGVDGMDAALVAETIAQADLMATAVGVNILPRIVPNIVQGLRLRWKSGVKKPLNIIICENLIDADKLLRRLISEQLDPAEKAEFEAGVGLVEASIGRMVPVLTPEMRKADCLRVRVEKYGSLPVDQSAFKGEIPQADDLCPFSPFEFFIRRKLYIHNMGHALTAYCGALEGCEFIWQAVENPSIRLLAQRAMTESARALSRRFQIPLEGILEHIDDLLLRFGNRELGDTAARVGKDTRRKLSESDRFAGAVRLCRGCGITPVYICAGLAAGLHFHSDDEGTAAVQKLLAEKGVGEVLSGLCGLDPNSPEGAMVMAFDRLLKTGAGAESLLAQCESFEEDMLEKRHIV